MSIHSTLIVNESTSTMVAVCAECGNVFHNKSNMNRHTKMVHSEKENETEYDGHEDVEIDGPSRENEESEEDWYAEEDDEEVVVWKVIADETAEDDGNVVESYKINVKFCRSLKNDETHQKVMKSLKRVRDGEDMGFDEALDYAADKKKFLILKVAKITRAMEEGDDEENE